MPIPPNIKENANQQLTAYCESKIPAHVKDKIRLSVEWKGNDAILVEHRPYFLDPSKWTESPIAKFRFQPSSKLWLLYCRDRNQRWHLFEPMPSSEFIDVVIAEIEHDRTGIFWG